MQVEEGTPGHLLLTLVAEFTVWDRYSSKPLLHDLKNFSVHVLENKSMLVSSKIDTVSLSLSVTVRSSIVHMSSRYHVSQLGGI